MLRAGFHFVFPSLKRFLSFFSNASTSSGKGAASAPSSLPPSAWNFSFARSLPHRTSASRVQRSHARIAGTIIASCRPYLVDALNMLNGPSIVIR